MHRRRYESLAANIVLSVPEFDYTIDVTLLQFCNLKVSEGLTR